MAGKRDLTITKKDEQTTPLDLLGPDLLNALDEKQRRYVELRVQGLTAGQAVQVLGVTYLGKEKLASRFYEHPIVQAAIQKINREAMVRMSITRETIAEKLLDAYTLSTTATEQIKALSELAKLYGLYEPEKREVSVSITETQLRQLTDDELARLAGLETVDAEYEEVDSAGAGEAAGDAPSDGGEDGGDDGASGDGAASSAADSDGSG